LHTEEFGSRAHEKIAGQIAQLPWLNFASLWILYDFPVANRKEGFVDSSDGVTFTVNDSRKYMNDKGLITRDRKTRKDVFYLYKALWNHQEETVFIAGRRLEKRLALQEFTLTVYSNSSALTLFRDGVEVSRLKTSGDPTGVVWKFPATMTASSTTFRVVSDSGISDEVTFEML
jgi:beta-galactosidase